MPHADVRFGSKADMEVIAGNVRFTPESGHWNSVVECPLCAKSGLMRRNKRCSVATHIEARPPDARFTLKAGCSAERESVGINSRIQELSGCSLCATSGHQSCLSCPATSA